MITGLLMAWMVIPGKDMGSSLESLEGTFRMISDSSAVIGIMATLPVIIAAHFMCSVMVTNLLSSVHNAMASVLMTALVWAIELLVHYTINPSLGNKWGPCSVLQLVGFGLVTFALCVYDGKLVRLPWLLKYPGDEKAVDEKPVACEERTSTSTETAPIHLDSSS